ncbi:metallophosphoesterase, partial [Flavobacterium sp.]|uniref:metallophosphoesterase family protein n=1 Tax=Flavobacterium sp. TaxID=239 RepID=UPI002632D02D
MKCLLLLFIVQSCATHRVQLGKKTISNTTQSEIDTVKNSHTFFLIGDAGNANETETQNTLALLTERLKKADKNSTILFLGDNIYPVGMPTDKNSSERATAETILKNQLKVAENFKGKTIVIPGNHDWYNGIKGLQEQELFVNEYLNEKKAFLPRKGCAIESVKISDELGLIVIDSQWFLEDWDNQPNINDNCSIKTREDFFIEFEDLVNKNQNKTTIIALHHPLMSNGPHGGQFSLMKQIYPSKYKIPAPILGSFINLLRKTSGISPQDLQNKQYTAFIKRIKTIIQNKKNVIVVSGHEHNLQYIDYDGVKQIVSGSASKSEAARAIYPTNFSFGGNGYAVLNVKKNGSSDVSFFSSENNKEALVFKHNVIPPTVEKEVLHYDKTPEKTVKASVYSADMTQKSGFYRFLWGKHYRQYYSTPIEARTVLLDTLYGGLKPTIAGGGHQSLSLRLTDKNGKEYVMRGLKKSATRLFQSVAFKDQNVENEFKNTVAEKFIFDFYTTSHPYTSFIVDDMADKVGIYHSNAELFYVPKQNVLGKFNEGFGDELYMIEERPIEAHNDLVNFGKPKTIVSTDDVLANIRKDEKYQIDEESYIRARLFDMLIGDWDRHADQWRWSEFEEKGKIIYKPIPRDRDQAFDKVDGKLLHLLMNIPGLRHIKSFEKEYPNEKWFNFNGHALDLAFIKKSDKKVWSKQAQYIVQNLSDADIDKAFDKLPKEIKDDATTYTIKTNLKIRKKGLEAFGLKYYDLLQKRILVVGTDKKDKFSITRMSDGKTQIDISRIKKEGEELQSTLIYDKDNTNEIWVYGLDDDDV